MTTIEIGKKVREARKFSSLTQRDLARRAGTGLRFVIEVEQGKPTCHVGKVLAVMAAVGITYGIHLPTEPIAMQTIFTPPASPPETASGAGWDNTFLD